MVVLLVAASLLHPAVHWRLIGWAKGEAFYQGRPTSYWREQWHQLGFSIYPTVDMRNGGVYRSSSVWPLPPTTWKQQLYHFLGLRTDGALEALVLVRTSDPAVVLVLAEFLESGDPHLAAVAMTGLGPTVFDQPENVPPEIRAVLVPVLLRLTVQEDDIGWQAGSILDRIEPQWRRARMGVLGR
jgi:hypothetical protein